MHRNLSLAPPNPVSRTLALLLAVSLVPAAMAASGPTNFGIDGRSFATNGFAFGAMDVGVPVFGGGSSPGTVANGFQSFTIDAQVIDEPGNPFDFSVFGGAGLDFGGAFGRNFVAADYQLEVDYKVLPNNAADGFLITLAQLDGFSGGSTIGEQFRWDFFGIEDKFVNGTPDAEGFVTLVRDITELPNPNTTSATESWDFRQQSGDLDGDQLLDFDAFENGAPNGARQIQIQSPFGSTDRLNVEIRSIRFVKKDPQGEVARLDGSGFDFSFGTFGANGAVVYDNGVDALTNLRLDVQDGGGADGAFGGIGSATDVTASSFDATTHSVEVTARLLPNNAAGSFNVIANELDGDDDAPGAGAESYVLSVDTIQFNDTSFTTVYLPLSAAVETGGPNSGFTNEGDGDITDFNLYELQLQSVFGSADRLNVEIESVRIVPTPIVPGDYNGDLVVDAADYTVWRDSEGQTGIGLAADGDGDGDVDADDYAFWSLRYGDTPDSVTPPPAAAGVPEPSALLLALGFAAACVRPVRGD